MKIHTNWDWSDFGFMFRIYKSFKDNVIIDIQIFWFNLWID